MPYELGLVFTYLCCPALLIRSPPKDPETNSEILIVIRKECEDHLLFYDAFAWFKNQRNTGLTEWVGKDWY